MCSRRSCRGECLDSSPFKVQAERKLNTRTQQLSQIQSASFASVQKHVSSGVVPLESCSAPTHSKGPFDRSPSTKSATVQTGGRNHLKARERTTRFPDSAHPTGPLVGVRIPRATDGLLLHDLDLNLSLSLSCERNGYTGRKRTVPWP